jgi:hypothetical protein
MKGLARYVLVAIVFIVAHLFGCLMSDMVSLARMDTELDHLEESPEPGIIVLSTHPVSMARVPDAFDERDGR